MTVIKTAFSNGCFGFGPCGGRKADRVRSGNPRAASCAGGADRAAAGRFERTAAAALGRSPRSFGYLRAALTARCPSNALGSEHHGRSAPMLRSKGRRGRTGRSSVSKRVAGPSFGRGRRSSPLPGPLRGFGRDAGSSVGSQSVVGRGGDTTADGIRAAACMPHRGHSVGAVCGPAAACGRGPFHKRGYRTFRQDTLVAVAVRAARISWRRGTRRAACS